MNKASGDDGIPIELFQILKGDAVKMLHSICQQIWKFQQWPQDWKRSVFIPVPQKGNAKECTNYHTIALISHTRGVMLKIPQARLQHYMNRELPCQTGFRKAEEWEDPLEKEMAVHSNILAWKIPWTLEPGRLPSMGSQSRTRLSDFTFTLF